jgi:HEAT repeat protein
VAGLLEPATARAESDASTSASAQPSVARSEHVLLASEGFQSVGVGFQSENLVAFTCGESCKEGSPQLVEPLPSEALGLKKSVRALRLKGGARLLWVRFGNDARHYSVVIRGASKSPGESAPPGPQVVLRGWAGEESPSSSRLVFEDGGLSLIFAAKEALCGREMASSTRIYDEKKGSFKGVVAPVLSGEERAKATPLLAISKSKRDGELLLKLSSTGSGSASEAVDAELDRAWDDGHEFTELVPPSGQPLKALGVIVSSPLSQPAHFWLATESTIYRVELSAGPETFFALEFPAEAVPSCVVAIQSKKPAPEIVLRVPQEVMPTTEDLVGQLQQAEPGSAGAALALRGKETAIVVGRAFPRMSTMARSRALDLAAEMPVSFRSTILVAALEFGSHVERARASEALSEVGKAAIPSIVGRLPRAEPAGRLQLSGSLAALFPAEAVGPLSHQLGRGSPAERLGLRRLVADLSDQAATRPHFEKLLVEQSGTLALPRGTQVELVRALLPKLSSFGPGARKMLSELAEDANFEEAYLLAPAVFQFFPQGRQFEQSLTAWLTGTLPKAASAVERAALSARILELLRDTEGLDLDLNREVRELISSDNPRVRRAALEVLAQEPGRVSEQELTVVLREDKWPQVRAASAEAASALSPTSETGRELARVLSKRLPRDEHPVARRAIARALGHIGDDAGVQALRKALKKDESYEVRAEAALSLGDLCDEESIESLSSYAQELGAGAMGDGPILLGLASLSALVRLNPSDLSSRVQPLLSKNVPGVLRNQVERRLQNAPGTRCSPAGK